MGTRDLFVNFGPVDALNPRAGYSLKIESGSGETILWTAIAPDTGEDLQSPEDCMRVIAMYTGKLEWADDKADEFDDSERFEEREPEVDPQIGFTKED